MKILQINVVLNKGSTGKITYELHRGLLGAGIESVVCYGRGELIREPGIYKVCSEWYAKFNNLLSRVSGLMYGGCFFSTNRLFRIIKIEKPDIVHIHCINGFFVNIYHLITWLKKHQIPTVLTLHAEFMFTANCGHAFDCDGWRNGCISCKQFRKVTHSYFFNRTAKSFCLMKTAFNGFDRLKVVSVSPWLKARAEHSLILKDVSHSVILNGVNNEVFHRITDKDRFQKYRGKYKKIIVHVTADFNDPLKGGQYVIELAKQMSDYLFVIIGNCSEQTKTITNVLYEGMVFDQKVLAEYYSSANTTLITSKRETFSMICAESLSCGTPVVGFRAGGPEQISLKAYSEFCEYGDVHALKGLIEKWSNCVLDNNRIANDARFEYSKEWMIQHYISLYKSFLQ